MKLLIGLIKTSVKASSMIEVIVAMVIVVISFSGLFMFFTRFLNFNKIKKSIENEYVVRECFLDILDVNNTEKFHVLNKGELNVQIEKKIKELVCVEIINSNNHFEQNTIGRYYIMDFDGE